MPPLAALRANLLYPDNPLSLSTLDRAWYFRFTEGDYVQHAVEHLATAANRIAERHRLAADEPIERMIPGKDGLPIRVIVDPKTGALHPVRE